MLSQRVKAALIFIPLVLLAIYLGGWLFNLFIIAVLLIAAIEYARLFNHMGIEPSTPILILGVLLFALQQWILLAPVSDVVLALMLFLAAVTAFIQHESGKQDTSLNFAVTLTGVLTIGWVGSFFIPLRNLPDGRGWLLTALPIVWLADCGAYFIGRWLGKRKMAPTISPGKTWAGLAGAGVSGTASGGLLVLLWRVVGFLPTDTPIWQGLVMGLILSILTPVGDLLISLFKRNANVKDTGTLIPGHGGALDRIDTWVWAALLGYYLVLIFTHI